MINHNYATWVKAIGPVKTTKTGIPYQKCVLEWRGSHITVNIFEQWNIDWLYNDSVVFDVFQHTKETGKWAGHTFYRVKVANIIIPSAFCIP